MTLRRRAVLQGMTTAGLTAGLSGLGSGAASAKGVSAAGSGPDWAAFDKAVRAEFSRQKLVGGAVAIVNSDGVLHRLTMGARDGGRAARITPDTHFLVASTTKSMSSLLVSTYVDDRTLEWDQPAIDAWSGFRAPTPELTRTLRVRDLMGMGTGLAEAPALSTFHQGVPTAAELLASLVNMQVVSAPGKVWIYNNTVYSVGAYLPLLATGVKSADLTAAYSTAMQERVFGPAGMASTVIADDPRGRVSNFSRGHGLDVFGRTDTLPYGAVGSYAPVGGGLSTLNDMANYVRLELRRGKSVTGKRVVSAGNLAQCWVPGVAVPLDPNIDPDAVSSGYAMGWIRERYKNGSSLVWHNGAIDGFTGFIGFLPEHDIGMVVLNNMNPFPNGLFLYLYVQMYVLSKQFGIDEGSPAKVSAAAARGREGLLAIGPTLHPVDKRHVAPFLGYYEGGYQVFFESARLLVQVQSRVIELRLQSGENYVMVDGLLAGVPVALTRDPDGVPAMDITGVERVRRTVGLA
ncbi:MAG TPA: serine hydrolase domain-containing protein [Frankiaceae bacterium]|jgi:CubicO group peptidase (beta-lactamase class C family)|nr:serine hydrolase domain-containing protein [Frankiaceae bacterium]